MKNKHNFFIESLEIRNSRIFDSDQVLIFSLSEMKPTPVKGIFYTVLIGPNGTRKSLLLRLLIDLFRDINDNINQKYHSKYFDGQYRLSYYLNSDNYIFSNINQIDSLTKLIPGRKYQPTLFKNGIEVNFTNQALPKRILALSIMPNDKFPLYKEENFRIYKYLGIKGKIQGSGVNYFIRQIIDAIISNYKNKIFRERLIKIAEFLNFREITISYVTAYSRLYRRDGSLSKYDLVDYFETLSNKYKLNNKKPPFKLEYWEKIKSNNDLLDNICSIFDDLELDDTLHPVPNSPAKSFEYNLFYEKGLSKLSKIYKNIEHLRKLGLLHPPSIFFIKDDSYSLNESSSGEFNFFSSMINLISNISDESLVLIDEPEVSLHPNWQMRYFECIRSIFSNELISSHFILATHSHFLVSDLHGFNSKLIGLKINKKLEIINFDDSINTFGWSAEEVLYRIFNIRTTRNAYFEYDLVNLVSLINTNSNDYQEIGRILNKLSEITLSDSDPLQLIISKGKKYLENAKPE